MYVTLYYNNFDNLKYNMSKDLKSDPNLSKKRDEYKRKGGSRIESPDLTPHNASAASMITPTFNSDGVGFGSPVSQVKQG